MADSRESLIHQGKALVRAIESLETIDSSGPFESAMTWLLLKAYHQRLRTIVAAAPGWVTEAILSASERMGDDRPARWISQN